MDRNTEPRDIILAANGGSSLRAVSDAAMRIIHDQQPEIRLIAAQALLNNPFADSDALKDLILNEPSVEVKGWLAMSFAAKARFSGLSFLNNLISEQSIDFSVKEKLLFDAALAICERSRRHLLELMRHIYSRDENVSKFSVSLCKMLIDDGDNADSKFLNKIIRERSRMKKKKLL